MRAYLDTAAYSDIRPDDVRSLREAMARSGVVLLPSLTVIEELLGPWETNRSAAVRRLQVARDLAGFDAMLKQARDLLQDAIRAYATGAEMPAPILPPPVQRVLADAFNRMANGEPDVSDDVAAIIAEVRAQKEQFQRQMMEALAQTRADLRRRSYSREERQAFTFPAYWALAAPAWAEALADRAGVGDACRARGLEGLLDVRPVRLAVGAMLSLVYSHVRGEFQPDQNDGYDLWHTIGASAAEVFVTRDQKLARRLARVPIDGFRIVTSLRELLGPPPVDTR